MLSVIILWSLCEVRLTSPSVHCCCCRSNKLTSSITVCPFCPAGLRVLPPDLKTLFFFCSCVSLQQLKLKRVKRKWSYFLSCKINNFIKEVVQWQNNSSLRKPVFSFLKIIFHFFKRNSVNGIRIYDLFLKSLLLQPSD